MINNNADWLLFWKITENWNNLLRLTVLTNMQNKVHVAKSSWRNVTKCPLFKQGLKSSYISNNYLLFSICHLKKNHTNVPVSCDWKWTSTLISASTKSSVTVLHYSCLSVKQWHPVGNWEYLWEFPSFKS